MPENVELPPTADGATRAEMEGTENGDASDAQVIVPSSNGQQNGQAAQGDGQKSDDEEQKKNALEWVVFAVGVAITFGVIGYLTYELITETNEPPVLEIALKEQRQVGPVLEIDVEVENTGDLVAEGAVIEVCGGPETCAQLTIPYVPSGSMRSGTVGLNTPLSGPLETRAVSYRTP